MLPRCFILFLVLISACFLGQNTSFAQSEEKSLTPLTSQAVLQSIQRGRSYLISQQQDDGSWGTTQYAIYKAGTTSLCLLSLLEAGMTPSDPAVSRGLEYLRNIKEPYPKYTYEVSLMVLAFAAANDGTKDKLRVLALAQKLENAQVSSGSNIGSWTYDCQTKEGNPDRSNSQYAILALRAAAYYGTPVSRQVWQRVQQHWQTHQNDDGGWAYQSDMGLTSTGSMTVAGIASLAIAAEFLHDEKETNPDGSLICCQTPKTNPALEKGNEWLAKHFSVHTNPRSTHWWLYYLYGVERAGRFTGKRFFGEHDWYREGARVLLETQSSRDGSWQGKGGFETHPLVGTPLALMFLSRGLAPVMINKMKLGPRDAKHSDQVIGDLWNRSPKDVRNLVTHISTLPKWPQLLTWQTLDFDTAARNNGLQEVLQAPILFASSDENLSDLMNDAQIDLLRSYLQEGGFLFLSRGCQSADFEAGVNQLVSRLYPDGSNTLQPLAESHPVYRSEYLLDPAHVKLYGVDVGCRTAIIYSPEDLACLWDKHLLLDPPNRSLDTKTAITRGLRIGVNIVAYVTGREPPNKLDDQYVPEQKSNDEDPLRSVLSLAKLRHSGDWDAAPNAMKKLLRTLEESFGVAAGNKPSNIPASDPRLYQHTLVYLHGQRTFDLSAVEIHNVRKYLENGGVLFADACCGSTKFDTSFREMMQRMFPESQLERIPVDHEMFSTQIGHDLSSVRRKAPLNENGPGQLDPLEVTGPPYLEGIKIGDRYVVIYSRYDISCALEKQTSLACIGYTPEDAAKIAMNIVLYSVLQDVTQQNSP